MKKELFRELTDNIKSSFEYNTNLRNHTTLKIGGPCKLFIEVENDNDLIKALNYFREKSIPYFLIGNGSNLLVSDEGFNGVVIKLGKKYDFIRFENRKNGKCLVNVGASKTFPTLTRELSKESISGIEWGCMIPGTMGGAAIMNAGAHGGEISHVVSRVEGVDINSGKKVVLTEDDLKFEYRGLNTGEKEVIITSICLTLNQGDIKKITEKIKKYQEQRKNKQPTLPNAGSVFKNPPGDYAGRLLEECGMKGYQIGEVKFSEKHANFIVNTNNGKAKDAWKLIEIAKEKVKELYGINLALELNVLGEMK
ncbi:UDP-N-acetylmuramate dehydrogenase [Natranaerofaba carboxydovora]|uniref:UDP-N-acetylmuramate dehydrogenase n=1 Tax=Natranaerofaba carboxydovora TaxID=2742683 RepID=UPI001F13BA2B|nr:UDP-N-acetylmuramate dehydrogenase [Natranaerofaba carboxydovora]UMZ73259.1 UDP-N-acetylenolpyruvoylglucosamine reductase [Natranaerofaba carboxydovora]